MSVGLVSVWGEEGDGGFGGRDVQLLSIRPPRDSVSMGGKGTGSRGDVGAGEGVSEIVCI